MIKRLLAYLLIEPDQLVQHEPEVWKASALRIILTTGFCLVTVIVLGVVIEAAQLQRYPIVYCVMAYYALLGTALLSSARYHQWSAKLLIVTLASMAISILLFIDFPEIATLGILILYSLPILVRIFFDLHLALLTILGNAVVYLFLSNYTHTLPAGQIYSHGFLFLLFNICLPLALFRVLHTLEQTASTYQKLNAQIKRSKEVYKDVFENAGTAALILDSGGKILKVNNYFLTLCGFKKNNVLGHYIGDFIFEQTPVNPNASEAVYCKLTAWDGRILDCKVRHSPLSDLGRQLCLMSDISLVKKAEQSLIEYEEQKQFLKNYDPLTQLPNRDKLLPVLRDHISLAASQKAIFAVMTFRINYFRYIDQKYGTSMGDILLSSIAKKIAGLVDEHVMLARLRGIVFCLVSRCYQDYNALMACVDDIYASLPASIVVKDLDIQVSYCCGVSVYPLDSSQADELINQSERALDLSRTAFASKPVFFDRRMSARQNDQIEIEFKLKQALENQALYIVFQPKVLHDGTVVGAEALVRIAAPENGSDGNECMGPDQFIPVAERCGLIGDIERFVLIELCRFIRRHLDAGMDIVPIAINISSQMIGNPGYAGKIINIITEYGVAPEKIELEITETSLMTGREAALENLIKLRNFGVAISIDDFGSGYSSLGKIIDMPVTTLKIDRSFLREIPHDANHVTLIRTIINLGKQLKLKLIAEGVEKEEQLAFLHQEQCDQYQGYYFFHPMSEEHFNSLLARQKVMAADSLMS